jgi:pimeloyl-ACP methyl ester carboxylesterase
MSLQVTVHPQPLHRSCPVGVAVGHRAAITPIVATALAAMALAACAPARPDPREPNAAASVSDLARTHYRTAEIDGVDVFYREAGRAGAPVVVLLHGFPTSSYMFRDLIPSLADRYRIIAPDYPGFGQSGTPDRGRFSYSFARYAELVDALLTKLHIERYALYVQDYGAPVGYRLALRHPERVTALIIQNGNAYEEGLKEFWTPIKAYWADGSKQHREELRAGLTPAATRGQYLDGVRDPSRVAPDSWVHDQALLDRPGIDEIMLDLFRDYAGNVALYPQFQAFFRTHRPPTLIVWGQNDIIFPADGARAYLRDLPDAELHLLDTGHFALEDRGEQIATLMRDFLARRLPR